MNKKMMTRASKSRLTLAAAAALFLLGSRLAGAQEVVIAREMNDRFDHPVAYYRNFRPAEVRRAQGVMKPPLPPQQVATDGSWNVNASGGWDVATNWLSSNIADGAGATGNFLVNINATRTITIDGSIASRILGIMNIGDTNNTNAYAIAATNGGTLTFDNTPNAANAQINMVSTSANNQISAAVLLVTSLDLSNASGNLLTISGNVSSSAASGTQTITALSGNETISGSISNGGTGGTVAVTQAGAGTLTLTGAANTYSGATTISSGKISINGTSLLGDGTGALFLSGGMLVTSANRNVGVVLANPIMLTADSAITTTSNAGTVNLNLGGTLTASAGTLTFRNDAAVTVGTFAPRFSTGDFTMGQPIVLDNGAGGGFTELADFNTTGTTHIYNGIISGNGSFRRSATTNGTGGETDFNAPNTFSGGVFLNDGIIGIGVNSTSAGNSPAIASGPLGTGTLTVTGNSTSLTALGGTRIVANPITLGGNLAIRGSNNLELSGPVAVAVTRTIQVVGAGNGRFSGGISGAGGITKSGGGTLAFFAANTYAGTTTIGNGTLVANADGALGGGGNVSLTASGVTLTLQNGTTNDYISDNATLSIVTGSTVNLNFTGTDTISQFVIDGIVQAPGTHNNGTDPTFLMGTGDLLVLIPEPSTWAMTIMGAGLLLSLQRFRRKKS